MELELESLQSSEICPELYHSPDHLQTAQCSSVVDRSLPPGRTPDEDGHQKSAAFMAWRVTSQFIVEGLAAAFMFTLSGLGFILLDQTNKTRLDRILITYSSTKIF